MYTHNIDRIADGNYRLRIYLGSSDKIKFEATRSQIESLHSLLINWMYSNNGWRGSNSSRIPIETMFLDYTGKKNVTVAASRYDEKVRQCNFDYNGHNSKGE